MQIPLYLSSFLLSSAFVSSSLIGSTIAKPIKAERDAAPTTTAASPAATSGSSSPVSASANNEALIAQLVTAGTAVDRLKLLQPEDFGYDFKNPPESAVTQGEGKWTGLSFMYLEANEIQAVVQSKLIGKHFPPLSVTVLL